jgi:hypothetical protein
MSGHKGSRSMHGCNCVLLAIYIELVSNLRQCEQLSSFALLLMMQRCARCQVCFSNDSSDTDI